MLIPAIVSDVTIEELINTPNIIAKTDFDFDNPKRYEANEPVQTPVKGNGIPTKIIKPKNFNRFTISPFFLVLLKIDVIIFSINKNFLKKFIDGPIIYIISTPIRIFPIIDKVTVFIIGISYIKIP
tara:strand:+ start:53 stop:430 length:378 start_codon:yes stop_codon:yes gene_type:complete